jgi:ligand-binding sensor domain-containing protein/signal transduction histidine kinase
VLSFILAWCEANFAPSAFAQLDSWSKLSSAIFEHLGRTSGLPNSLVQAIAEDGDGFIWVEMPSGLARWDGYRFRSYVVGHEESAMLPDKGNFIEWLHVDAGGDLWVGLSAGGVARYDRAADCFTLIPLAPGYPDRVVHAITDDGAGGLWIGTEDGLDRLPAGVAVAEHPLLAMPDGGGSQRQRIMRLLLDKDGTLWVGTGAGLYRLDQGESKLVSVPIKTTNTGVPSISALFEDSTGRLWIGTLNQGAFVLEKGATLPRAVQETGGTGSLIENQRVSAITEVATGQIWLGTIGQGIVSLDTRTGWTGRIRHDRAQSTSLQSDDVLSLYRDHSGEVWVGSAVGLDRYDPSRGGVSTLFGGTGGGNTLSKPEVWSVLPYDQNRILLGLGDEGIDTVEPADGRITEFLPKGQDSPLHLPHAPVRSLTKWSDGSVFAATLQGLFRIDAAGSPSRVTVSPDQPDMGVDTVTTLGGALWVGTRNDGLWKLDVGSGRAGSRIGPNSLTDERVLSLAAAPDGHLWVGTRNGLNFVDPATGQTERIFPDSHDPQSLPPGLISSLLIDRQGRLWVATEGSGIALLERRDAEGRPRFRHFGKAQGIPHLNVDKLLMDRSGKIWASTDEGLASIDPDSFVVRPFGQAEGVALQTYWINSGAVTEQGDVLFGGVGGLTIVHPDEVSNWSYVPPIVVTDLRVGGKAVPPGQILGRGAKEPILIDPGANSLAVEFSALDFSAPERNRYAYKLEGFDADWVETDSSRRLASYTNLQPGTYKLRLRGSNRDGVWAETSLDLPIRVLPAWYQTLWFRLALAAGGVLLVVLVVRSRTAYYRRRQEKLERQVERRTVELKTTTDQLKALLDNSGQGFLSFGEDLIVDSEYSLACETMLGLAPAGMTADRALFGSDERQAELFRRAAEAFRQCDDYRRRSVLLSLFPRDIKRDGLIIDASYRRIDNDRLMAILTDVTEERRLAEKLDANYRRQDMVVAAVIESRDFFAAVENYRRFIEIDLPRWLARDDMPDALLTEIFRTVHTFKGVLGQFNFERSPKALHEFEEVLQDFAAAEGSETVEMLQAVVDLAQFRRYLSLDLAVIEGTLGSEFIQNGARIAVPAALAEGFSQLGERLLEGGSVNLDDPAERELLRDLSRMHHIALDRVLHGFDRMVRQLADSQGKAVAALGVEGGEGILIDPRRYRDFLQALVHVFRNAVTHGIESPDDRVDAGKDEAGMILCTVTQDAGSVTIAIADDGAGIDIEGLRARLPAGLSDDAVLQSVFQDSVTTRIAADEFSGRGVGLGAVWQAVEVLGGKATVSSVRGRGTVFKFTLPIDGGGISVAES